MKYYAGIKMTKDAHCQLREYQQRWGTGRAKIDIGEERVEKREVTWIVMRVNR